MLTRTEKGVYYILMFLLEPLYFLITLPDVGVRQGSCLLAEDRSEVMVLKTGLYVLVMCKTTGTTALKGANRP
jgi:hypothetical protein